MPLSIPQSIIAKDNTRFRVVVAGRRFGKTTLAIREICYYARLPEKEVYYIAPSYRMAKTIVWKKLKSKLRSLNWIKKINETEMSIILVNNSTISLKGADNPDSLRGVSLSFAVLDEFVFMDPDIWYEVIRPSLSDQQGNALFITTPSGKGNWGYDLYCQEKSSSNWKSYSYTTLDGGFVTENEIMMAKNDLDERTFRQEYLASFESYGNIIAYAFNRDNHLVKANDYDIRELHIGVDFNNTPITAAIMEKKGDKLHIFDEVHIKDSNTNELALEIKSRYPSSRLIAYPDPAGKQRKTSANGQTDFTILANHGFIIKAPNRHDLVRDRINATNSRLANNNLLIDPKCKHTIESLEKFAYKEGTQVPNKNQGYDHMFDALSYCVAFLYPIRRIIENKPVERFGHRIA
jgi:phage terminase large subunit